MFINNVFNKGKVKQALCLNGEFIFIPSNKGKKVCRNVRELRKLFKSEKEMFDFLKKNDIDICFYMK